MEATAAARPEPTKPPPGTGCVSSVPPAPPAGGTAQLAAALSKVQATLPTLNRDRTVTVEQKNGSTYSYSYATLAHLSDAVLPLLAANGLAFTSLPGLSGDGKMCLRYLLLHESGESLAGEFPLSAEGGIQVLGGRITYARRYCLAAVVGIAADEDDESRLGEDGARGSAQRAPQRPRMAAPPTVAPAPAAEPAGGPTAKRATRPPRSAAPPPLPGDTQSAEAMTEPQKRALMAAYSGHSREDRLAHARELLGRDLGSFTGPNGLTKAEAKKILDAIQPREDDR